MTYAEAIQFLNGLQIFGANFSLETPRRLAALAGNPQNRLRFIHVAGTNGKGSTCAMLESIYRAAGLRVGLFTSPHLVSFRERIQVNRQLISETEVARLVAEIRPSPDAGLQPTFFEFVTVLALKHFAEQQCDLVIWETGLGGQLDATNIVTPLASVITNIAFDHQQWLGDTLAKISAEKAGIIKPGVPTITAAAQPEVLAVIERVARENQSPLTQIQNPKSITQNSELSLRGEHQIANAALALATVEVLQPQIPVTAAQIREALATVRWPGRLQLLERGAQKFLLDGAHNIAGAAVLGAELARWRSSSSLPSAPTLVLGMLADKDWRAMCEILAPLTSRVLVVPVGSERTANPEQLATACRTANPRAEVGCCTSLSAALAQSARDEFVVIAGSLYLIGEALARLDPAYAGAGDERRLNEWRGGAAGGAR